MNPFRTSSFRSKCNHAGNRRGQAMVELAILLPVLLLLVFGMIEMSNAWRTFQVVTNSAREGARVAILTSSDRNDVLDRIESSMLAGGLNYDENQITLQCFEAAAPGTSIGQICTSSGQLAQIRIQYPFTFQVLGRLGGLVPINITSTSTMRHE